MIIAPTLSYNIRYIHVLTMTNVATNQLTNQIGQTSQIDQIDRCLPQTQCTLCSYPRCREYATAIACGEAEINQCPPGGEVTIQALSALLDKPALALNEEHGINEPKQLAYIDEADCIGCKLCIKACPVDCIVGSAKLMHTVVVADCTGCKLCLPVCPTDCIELVAADLSSTYEQQNSPWPGFTVQQVEQARFNSAQTIQRNRQREQVSSERKKVHARKQMQQEILAAVARKSRQQHEKINAETNTTKSKTIIK